MTLTRRDAVALGGLATLAAGCGVTTRLAAVASPRAEAVTPARAPAAHVLGRAGFGHSPESLAEVESLGVQPWLAAQTAATDAEPAILQQELARLDVLHFSPWELRDWPERSVVEQLQRQALLRATHSPWQLRERMVDFWSNHFNVYAKKGMAAYRKTLDERTVVRPHVFGKFRDMLFASARSAAMLVYLDQQASTDAHPNENYARELLELHTLGVDGGYTQRDVMEVARCFTGWTEERQFLRAKGQFRFDPSIHDDGRKTVLGREIPTGGGESDGVAVLNMLAAHPSTARHIARKLCVHFLGERSPGAERAVEQAFLRSDGDTTAMLRALFAHPDFLGGKPALKRPLDFTVSAVRAVGARTDGGGGIQAHLAAMGQAPYQWPMPDGYPVEPEAWTGTLLARWNFAHDLAHGRVPGTTAPKLPSRPDDVVSAVLGSPQASPACQRVLRCVQGIAEPAMVAALALCSPEFQYR